MHQTKSSNVQFCSFDHILSYTMFYFWYSFFMCVGYRIGRYVLQDDAKYSLSLFLIER